MNARRIVAPLALLASALVPAAARAQIVVPTYQPAGAATTNDPAAYDTWLRANMRNGATAGITTDYARSGNGSVLFTSPDGTGKADLELYLDPGIASVARLGYFSGFSYDYLRDASSTVAGHLAPSLRLLVDADADMTADGYLVYEPIYNGIASIPTNAWQTALIGGTTNLWWRQFGVGTDEVYNRTFADYVAGTYTPTAGFKQITGNSLLMGLSTGVGSGWNGTFRGAVDNVGAAVNVPGLGQGSVTFNFEVEEAPTTATPEPASLSLMAGGLLALGAAVRRRRQA